MFQVQGIDGSSSPTCHLLSKLKAKTASVQYGTIHFLLAPKCHRNSWKLMLDCGQQLTTNWLDGEMMFKLEDII